MKRSLFPILILLMLAGSPALAHVGNLEHVHLTEHLSVTGVAILFLLALAIGVWLDLRHRRPRGKKMRKDQ